MWESSLVSRPLFPREEGHGDEASGRGDFNKVEQPKPLLAATHKSQISANLPLSLSIGKLMVLRMIGMLGMRNVICISNILPRNHFVLRCVCLPDSIALLLYLVQVLMNHVSALLLERSVAFGVSVHDRQHDTSS